MRASLAWLAALSLLGAAPALAATPSCSLAVADRFPFVGDTATVSATCTGAIAIAWTGCSSVGADGLTCFATAATAGPASVCIAADGTGNGRSAACADLDWQPGPAADTPRGCVITAAPPYLDAPGSVALTVACSTGATATRWLWSGAFADGATTEDVSGTLSSTTTFSVRAGNAAGYGPAVSLKLQVGAEVGVPSGTGDCNAPAPDVVEMGACGNGMTGSILYRMVYACASGAWVPNGLMVVANSCTPAGASPSFAAYSAIEYERSETGSRFITADPDEALALDQAGSGWTRTGTIFRVWSIGQPGTTPVCRFYGNWHADPATGRRIGPDSHFYTADPAECESVKAQRAWVFEGLAFAAWPPAQRMCPSGTRPVYRLYDNRPDIDHRYVPDLDTAQALTAQGWIDEGIGWCSGF